MTDKRKPDPRSGIDAETGEFHPTFEGQRPPLTSEQMVGNDVAVKHGAYAKVKLGPRVDELAAELRELVPGFRPPDEIALRVLCLALARLERSAEAQEGATTNELERLRADERGWANTVRRYLNDLGLTPMSRSKLRLDVAITTRALTLTGLVEEARELAEHEGAGES